MYKTDEQLTFRRYRGSSVIGFLWLWLLRMFALGSFRYLCVAGKVESWCILCDLSGISISSFPLPLLFKLMQLIQGSYRGRLYRFYILHAPRLFHFVAKPLVASLPSTTAKKFRVFTSFDEWQQERRAQFASHQIEKKFGGTAPDVTEVLTTAFYFAMSRR